MPDWISIHDRLPETDGSYLVHTAMGTVTTAHFYAEKHFPPTRRSPGTHRTAMWQANRKVTHWMPLPEPPKTAAHE